MQLHSFFLLVDSKRLKKRPALKRKESCSKELYHSVKEASNKALVE